MLGVLGVFLVGCFSVLLLVGWLFFEIVLGGWIFFLFFFSFFECEGSADKM